MLVLNTNQKGDEWIINYWLGIYPDTTQLLLWPNMDHAKRKIFSAYSPEWYMWMPYMLPWFFMWNSSNSNYWSEWMTHFQIKSSVGQSDTISFSSSNVLCCFLDTNLNWWETIWKNIVFDPYVRFSCWRTWSSWSTWISLSANWSAKYILYVYLYHNDWTKTLVWSQIIFEFTNWTISWTSSNHTPWILSMNNFWIMTTNWTVALQWDKIWFEIWCEVNLSVSHSVSWTWWFFWWIGFWCIGWYSNVTSFQVAPATWAKTTDWNIAPRPVQISIE